MLCETKDVYITYKSLCETEHTWFIRAYEFRKTCIKNQLLFFEGLTKNFRLELMTRGEH